METLDNRVKKYWLYSESIICAIIAIVILFFYVLSFYFSWNTLVKSMIIITFILLLLSYIAEVLFINKIKYKLFKYKIGNDFIIINKGGGLFNQQITIPIKEVNYIDIKTNIIMNRYNICNLQISTVAYEHSIEGICVKKAFRHKKHLKMNKRFYEGD